MATDSLIQLSLRTHFRSCTILTIAHRLATIMDYDRVLVVDFGRIKEFDTPANLLRRGDELGGDHSNIFSGLVNETGPQTSELLKRLAFDAEQVRLQRPSDVGSSAAGATALLRLEQSVWHDSTRMAESSVSHRVPRPILIEEEEAECAPAGGEELEEYSMVKWHGANEEEEEEEELHSALLRREKEEEEEEDETKFNETRVHQVHVQIRPESDRDA